MSVAGVNLQLHYIPALSNLLGLISQTFLSRFSINSEAFASEFLENLERNVSSGLQVMYVTVFIVSAIARVRVSFSQDPLHPP